jgi:hypothetical protein
VLVQPRGWAPENWDFVVLPIVAKTSAHPGRMTKYCRLRYGCRNLPHYSTEPRQVHGGVGERLVRLVRLVLQPLAVDEASEGLLWMSNHLDWRTGVKGEEEGEVRKSLEDEGSQKQQPYVINMYGSRFWMAGVSSSILGPENVPSLMVESLVEYGA